MVQERTKDGSLTTEGQSLILSTGEMAQAALQVSGTWTGTLSIEGTVDGTNWFSLNSSDPATGLIATSLTANGQYVTNVGGLAAVRLRASAAMTGTANIAMRATLAGAGNGATGESSVYPSNYAVDDSAMPATPNVLPVGGEYRSAADTYTDGDAVVQHFDVSGNQLISQGTAGAGEDLTNNVLGVIAKPVSSSSYSAPYSNIMGTDVDVSAKASAGCLLSAVVTNANAAVRYFQIHDKASAPANPNVPVLSLPIPAGTANNPGYLFLGKDILGDNGMYLATGVAYGISTTNATFTAATTTDHNEFVEYI